MELEQAIEMYSQDIWQLKPCFKLKLKKGNILLPPTHRQTTAVLHILYRHY